MDLRLIVSKLGFLHIERDGKLQLAEAAWYNVMTRKIQTNSSHFCISMEISPIFEQVLFDGMIDSFTHFVSLESINGYDLKRPQEPAFYGINI